MNNPREDGFVVLGDYVLKFERDEIADEFMEIARTELGETQEVKDAALKTFKELVGGVENFFIPLDREDILLQFLRPCRFDTAQALALMKRFYSFKYNNPKLCANLLPSTETKAFEQNLVTVLPNRDQYGRRIIIIEAGSKWNPKTCSIYDLMRAVLIMIEAAIYEPQTQIAGGLVIIDVKNLSLSHVLQVTPSLAKTIVNLIEECLPLRVKAIHIVNQAYFFNMVYAIFKPFLGEKLKRKLHFHGQDRESLLKHIDAKYLPTRYGGELDLDVPGKKIHDLFCYYEDSYKEASTFGYSKKENS